MPALEEAVKKHERSEEVHDIINRMPVYFGRWAAAVVLFLVAAMVIFGFAIRYPDTVTGVITINAKTAPVKLIAQTSGKIELFDATPQDAVKEGQYVAIIQNAANTNEVQQIKTLLQQFNVMNQNFAGQDKLFPASVSLGELNVKYFGFLNSLHETSEHQRMNVYDAQVQNLQQIIQEQANLMQQNYEQKALREKNLELAKKMFERDSTLFTKRASAEAELDKVHRDYLGGKESYQNSIKEIIGNRQQIQEARGRLQQIHIEKKEKEEHFRLQLLSSYNELVDNITTWEQKYVFKAPMNGKIEFLKFWTDNQFVQAGEEVFTIVPIQNNIIGQMYLPAQGAGKVKPGQEVIIKLDNYPYIEYGSIKGKVRSISLTTNQQKNEKGIVENYLALVELPEQLKTNYGATLDFKYEIRGSADIITNDRKLIERLFDNLKYVMK